MIETGLFSLLSADPGLTALIGTCLYPIVLPDQPSLPCATYLVVSSQSEYTFEAASERWLRLQVDCWGNTYGDCLNVGAAVDNILDGFQGALSDGSYVKGAFRDVVRNSLDEYSRLKRVVVEYVIHYR